MRRNTKSYVMEVSYPANQWPELDRKLNKVAKQFGGRELGSGMGFGFRDLSFEFQTVEQRKKAKIKFSKLGYKTHMEAA